MPSTPSPESTTAAMLASTNPANGDFIGTVPVTPAEWIPRIVEEAREAATGWRALSFEERGALLIQGGEMLMGKAEALGELLSREMGKTRASGRGEVKSSGKSIQGKVARVSAALAPHTTTKHGVATTVVHDPVGVCGVIAPWNYPMNMIQWMVVPALMAGNAVVLKPSEETPLIAQAFVDTLNEFLPPGILRIVHGRDGQGRALVNSTVDLIAFTGSRAVGVHSMAAAATSMKRLILELGGKDPLLVLKGADVQAAADFAVSNSFDNTGQMCVSTERVLVHQSLADEFENKVVAAAKQHRAGPWDEDGVTMGPMIHGTQRAHVLSQLIDAVSQGARLLLGTTTPRKFFVDPTVITGVTDEMDIAKEETFGPVVSISRFTDTQKAIRSANAGPYGLGAVVFGATQAAEEAAAQLNAGMIGINRSIFGVGDVPWVGAKQSGFGYHGSPDGWRQFSQTRVISRVE